LPLPTLQQSEAVGLIPCNLDLKTGSTSVAEKRKSNSEASQRFRKRKREAEEREKELQTKIKHLQVEIDRLTNENSSLCDQLAYYQSRYFPPVANVTVQLLQRF
jgi:predicted nuclease with TOPRIM domain